MGGGEVSDPLCLSSSLVLKFFLINLFKSATLLTRMTGLSLHVQWPLTSQSRDHFLKEDKCFLLRIKIHPCRSLYWDPAANKIYTWPQLLGKMVIVSATLTEDPSSSRKGVGFLVMYFVPNALLFVT
jgi:hypothetical protein